MQQCTRLDPTAGPVVLDVLDHPAAGGAAEAPVVLALHGFPADATSYDRVAARLTARGVRVVAPHQRGYSPGARPPGAAAYAVPALVADALAVADATGAERVHLVGHDWGGAVAWAFAAAHPERLASLTVLSTPHPAAMLPPRPAQALRSSYMAFFQLPALPEAVLLRSAGALVRTGLPPEDAERYLARLRAPGAATAALDWYRALRGGRGGVPAVPAGVPVTYVSGRRDPFFAAASVAGTREHVRGAFRHVRLDEGHWLPERRDLEVAAELLRTVHRSPATPG